MRGAPPRSPARKLAVAIALIVATSAGRGQEPPPVATEPSPPHDSRALFVESIDVNVVNVEVVVTSGGRPVPGLTASDFEVLDDGRPVAVSNFYEVRARRRNMPTGPDNPPLRASPLPAPAAATPAGTTEPESMSVVILVDDALISALNRGLILRQLRKSVADHLAGSSIMVAHKNQAIQVVQPFTTDLEQVEKTLRRVERGVGLGAAMQGRRDLLRLFEETRFSSDQSRAGDLAEQQFREQMLEEEENQISRRTSRALGVFLKSLADLPGRKALLYVNDRYPANEETFPDFDTMLAEAGASRTAFYPFAGDGRSAGSARRGALSSGAEATARFELAGLNLLANRTGGKVSSTLTSTDGLLQEVARDLSSYYSLGYPSPHGGDGKTHSVRVRVKQPNVVVRHMTSYVDKSADLQMVDTLLGGLFLDRSEDPAHIRLSVGKSSKPRSGDKKRSVVSVDVEIPLAGLELVEKGGQRLGQVSIFVMVQGSGGGVSPPTKTVLPVRLPVGTDPATSVAKNTQQIALRPGEYEIAVAVRDDFGSLRAASTLPVRVRK